MKQRVLGAYCFKIHFRRVHDKFARLAAVSKQLGIPLNQKKYNALKRDIGVLSKQNIREIERRIDALSATLSRGH